MFLTPLIRLLGFENPLKPLRREAEAGDPESQFLLAEAYVHGGNDYFPRDYDEAVKWYRKAAESDYPEAQVRLGDLYYAGGCGLPEDLEKAEEWFKRAEQNGHHQSIVSIALMHRSGVDRSTNLLPALSRKESYALHKKGAELNLSFCQSELANLYYEGKAVPRNLVHAHAWYQIASENDREISPYRRNELNGQMSIEERAQADQLAGQLRAFLEKEQRSKQRLQQPPQIKPWLRQAKQMKLKSKSFTHEAYFILRQAGRVENRIASLSAFACLLSVIFPAAILITFFLPYTITENNFGILSLWIIIFLFVLKHCIEALNWRIYQKRRVIAHYLEVFRRVRMPRRLYRTDRAETYIRRILDSNPEYGSELTPKVKEIAKDLEQEISWRTKLESETAKTRFTDALDEALDAHSPADEAPPDTYSTSVCEWLNQASLEHIEDLSYLSRNEARLIHDACPFESQQALYSFLKGLKLEPHLRTVEIYYEFYRASEKWQSDRR